MAFKFEKLEVWQVALEYLDLIYKLAEKLKRPQTADRRPTAELPQTNDRRKIGTE